MSKIIVGVTGSISAYKACDVVSGLVKTGNEVQVVMTENSLRFCPIDVLAILSKREVLAGIFENNSRVHHIEFAEWCDKLVIVPASYNTINKIRYGIADNKLLDICSAIGGLRKKKFIFPAMNNHMLDNQIVVSSLNRLKSEKWIIGGTDKGLLACGSMGNGKLLKPRKIVEIINKEY